jgi:gas vesicle protein
MSETPLLLVNHNENVEPVTLQNEVQPAGTSRGDSLARVGIGAVVGAVLGAVTVSLADKVTVENVNNTVKGVGEVVKGTANSVNNTVKGVGNAVKNVAENINYVVEDVGATVKGIAKDVNQNVKGIVNVVRGVNEGSNYTVESTVDAVNLLPEDVSQNLKSTVDVDISDVVGQQITVASVYEQPQVAENEEAGIDWYQHISGKDENSPDPKDWKQVAQALGKSKAYINRIATLAESGQPLPDQARTEMEQDFSAYKQISIELWQWHQAAKALGKNEAYLKQIAEVAIAFYHSTHPTPLPKKAVFTMQQNIRAYREKSKPAIQSQATVAVVAKEPTQRELAYRLRYQKLRERVRQLPQFKNSSIKEVDIVIVIIALEEAINKDEIEGIIVQSEQIKTWKQSMSEKEFKSKAANYIREVYTNAINLRQNLLKQRVK